MHMACRTKILFHGAAGHESKNKKVWRTSRVSRFENDSLERRTVLVMLWLVGDVGFALVLKRMTV